MQAPTEALVPEAVTAIAAGHYHTLCLAESGTVWCMGSNEFGQLGVGAKDAQAQLPRLVKALTGGTYETQDHHIRLLPLLGFKSAWDAMQTS